MAESVWPENDPLYKPNKRCPICGKSVLKDALITYGFGSIFDKITCCSDKCADEFARKVWKLGLING